MLTYTALKAIFYLIRRCVFPRFLLQLNPKIASSTLYGFSFHSVFLLLRPADVCKECVLWLKCKITVFLLSRVGYWIKCLTSVRLQSFTRSIVQPISSLWRPLRFPNRKLCKDQVLDCWMCSYFRLLNENNCIEF